MALLPRYCRYTSGDGLRWFEKKCSSEGEYMLDGGYSTALPWYFHGFFTDDLRGRVGAEVLACIGWTVVAAEYRWCVSEGDIFTIGSLGTHYGGRW